MQQRLGEMFLYGAFRYAEAFGGLGITQPFDPVENEDLPGSLRQFGYRRAQSVQPLPRVGLVFLCRAVVGYVGHVIDGCRVCPAASLLANVIDCEVVRRAVKVGAAVQDRRAARRILFDIAEECLLRQIRGRFRVLEFVGEIGLQLPPMREEQPLQRFNRHFGWSVLPIMGFLELHYPDFTSFAIRGKSDNSTRLMPGGWRLAFIFEIRQ